MIKQPTSVCVALVPWKFLVAIIICKVSAALAAIYTIVAKPSSKTPLSVIALAHLLLKAGCPTSGLNVVTTNNTETLIISEVLCKHPFVRKILFTSCTSVRKFIAKHCSDGVKKVTLELGETLPS